MSNKTYITGMNIEKISGNLAPHTIFREYFPTLHFFNCKSIVENKSHERKISGIVSSSH